MTIRQAIPAMRGVNYYVPLLNYAVDVGLDALVRADLGAPITLDVDGILAAQSITSAGSTGTFASTYTAIAVAGLAKYGRNLTVVASGTATSTVTVYGYDYLGQPMSETLTLASTSPVAGLKAFKWITSVAWSGTSAITINLGWGNVLGIPYRATRVTLFGELTAGAAPTAGTLVVGAATTTTQTATTADPRGTYTPNQACNGVLTYEFSYHADVVNGLHGNRHFHS